MSGYQYLRFPEFSGVLSASSATPSADSTERQARKIRKIHRILALVAGCVLCLSGYERAVLSRMSTFDDPSALLGKSLRSLIMILGNVLHGTSTTVNSFQEDEMRLDEQL